MTQLYEIVPTEPTEIFIGAAPPEDYTVTGWGVFHSGFGVTYQVNSLTSPNSVTGRYDGVDLQGVWTAIYDAGGGGLSYYRGIQLGGALTEFPAGFEWEDNGFVYNADTVTAEGWALVYWQPLLQPVAATGWVKQMTEAEFNAVRYEDGVSYRPLLRTFDAKKKVTRSVGQQRIDLSIGFPNTRR